MAPADPLPAAQQCFAASDMACVLRLLEPPQSVPESAPLPARAERLRLLAFACARLDRHGPARGWFAQWLQLDPALRLDRDSTPPLVWQDFAAAWLAVHGADLELQPVVGARPQLAAPKPTPADWPRFAPPPRSPRDQARDFVMHLALTVAADPAHASRLPAHPVSHLGVWWSAQVEPRPWLRAGAVLHAMRWYDGERDRLRGDILLEGALRLMQWPAGRLEAAVQFGPVIEPTAIRPASGAVGGGVRYHRQAADQAVGFTVGLLGRQALGGDRDFAALLVAGVALRPALR